MHNEFDFFAVKILNMEIILEPWPWFVSGPLIAFTLFLLLIVGKKFGMSSNLKEDTHTLSPRGSI